MNKIRLKVAFLFLCVFVSLLPILIAHTPTTKAQTSQNTPTTSTVWREYPFISPHLVQNDTHYIYVTDWGNYTFIKGNVMLICNYIDRSGTVTALNSTFWIKASGTALIAPFNPVVVIANDTYFEFKNEVRYAASIIVGYLTQTFDFNRTDLPKISIKFEKTASWTYGDFQVYWILGTGWQSNTYIKLENETLVNVGGSESIVGSYSKCWLTTNNTLRELFVTWEDEGIASLGKGSVKASDVSCTGIIVYFNTNDGQIDPSTVGTSTAISATSYPFQRKSFYANGRFWVFWSDGTNMVYKTSTDGSTWSSATTVRACTSGQYFSVWFDGTYLHYAYAYASPIYYRRGMPNSDGTITWSAAEQTVATEYNSASFPMVSVDSYGYVWIGYRDYDGSTYYGRVIKSGNNDGTWGTTPSNFFPYPLLDVNSRVSVIPLTSGKMLVIYAYDSATVRAQRWNGTAFDAAEVHTTLSIFYGYEYSAVAQGDDVHLVFLKSTGYDIMYTKYTYSNNSFSAETTLQAGATSSSAPVLSIDTATNDLYVFWAGYPTANHIYYRKYTASTDTWEDRVDWITETALTGNNLLTCFYQAGGNSIGLVYMTGTTYNVVFAYLPLNNPPTIGEFQAPATVYANKYFYLNATINDADGIAQFVNATIEINGSIILKWDAITKIFNKTDPNNYCAIDSANSFNSTISGNSTAYKLSFKIKLYWNYTEGNISVSVTNTKVFDNQGASSSNSYANLFYFENDLIVYSASVNDARINPSQSITFTGKLYYEGTTIPPEDVSGITAKVDLGTTNKGSTTTIGSDGSFSISFSGEGTVGSYSYTVYCVTVRNSVQNQTLSVIVDRMKIVLKGANDTRVDVNAGSRVYFNATWEYDNALFQGGNGTLYINATAATWDATNKYWYIDVSNSSILVNNYGVSSVTDSVYGISTLNDVVGTEQIIWDKDKMDSFTYSGGTLANMTFKLLSEYYSNTLNNTNLTLNIYLNDSLLDSISATSNDTGLVFVSLLHNIYDNGTLTFNLTDSDGIVSYSYSCPVEVYVENIEVFSIDPVALYTGDSLTITMDYKPKANINGTYVSLSNVYWKALIYTDKYYGYYNFEIYNGSFANALESRVELMPIALSEGSYMLNMTFYIRGSDTFLGSATSPYFVVKSRPSTSGGAPSSVVKLPLTVVVRDYKGGYAQGVYVVVIDQYNATVWEGTTDNWGTAMTTLNPGTYNVTIKYDNETLSDTVTLSSEPITKEFTLPGLTITPVTVTLDSYSILWLGIGLIGAIGAVILERKEKTVFAVALGLVTIGAVLHSLLVITHQMSPYFTVPQFNFSSLTTLPSFSLPSLSLPQVSLDMQTITFIAVGITVPVVVAYVISQRGGTHKRRVRVGKFGEERRKRVWK